jgi:hypothetical protein
MSVPRLPSTGLGLVPDGGFRMRGNTRESPGKPPPESSRPSTTRKPDSSKPKIESEDAGPSAFLRDWPPRQRHQGSNPDPPVPRGAGGEIHVITPEHWLDRREEFRVSLEAWLNRTVIRVTGQWQRHLRVRTARVER